MARHGRSHDEEGAVAILYSVALLLMLGILALTIDLGALRYDRAHSQTVADTAVLAGALDVPELGPREACRTAWGYFLANSAEEPTPGEEPDCTIFPETMSPCPASELGPAIGQTENYEVRIWWPIPQDSELLDGRYDPAVDGSDPCERLAVHVGRTRGFIFGPVFDQNVGTTGAPAVARSKVEGGSELVAALVVLDPFNCATLTHGGGASGTGAIWVFESYNPETDEFGTGIIAVDSDASAGSGGPDGCTNHTVIEMGGANTQILGGVQDEDQDGQPDLDGSGRPLVRDGAIYSYGVQVGRGGRVFDDLDVQAGRLAGGDSAPPLPGDPPTAGNRVLREPWVHRYECRGSYDDVGGQHVDVDPCPGDPDDGVAEDSQYITTLRSEISAVSANPAGAGYTVVNQGPGNVCNLSAHASLTDPNVFVIDDPDGVWFDCNLTVASNKRLIVPRGDVVVMGDLKLQGALAVNVRTTVPPNTEDVWVYVDGAFDKSGGAALRLGNPSASTEPNDRGGVFMLLGGPATTTPGQLKMSGGSSSGTAVTVDGTSCDTSWTDTWLAGALTWTPCHFTWVAPFRDARFADLALWSEYLDVDNQPHSITGDVSNLIADGIFYMPNAKFHFSGSGQMGQQRAQFVAYRLQAQGGGALKVRPDPERARDTSEVVVRLIR